MQSSKLPCEVGAPAFSALIRKQGTEHLRHKATSPGSPCGLHPKYLPDSQVKGRVPVSSRWHTSLEVMPLWGEVL